jgi:hypothetical protein
MTKLFKIVEKWSGNGNEVGFFNPISPEISREMVGGVLLNFIIECKLDKIDRGIVWGNPDDDSRLGVIKAASFEEAEQMLQNYIATL